MATYSVHHLDDDERVNRPWSLRNPHLQHDWAHGHADPVDPAVQAFHRSLPDYNETPLHVLDSLAKELGVAHVFLKDESTRFGLPAFKILGASWACHRAICQRLHLPAETTLDGVRNALKGASSHGSPVRLVTSTEGNWGRACARMSSTYGLPCSVYVSGLMSQYTQDLLRKEGADVRVIWDGSYDDAIAAMKEDVDATGALMVMDTSWAGYEEVPQWVTDGYRTMLTETDRQVAASTAGGTPNTLFVSVGVGSWAHSVVSHYRTATVDNQIITVEPDTAASLKESLHCNRIVPIRTGYTIMAGMNCGTTSTIAWPILRDGVHTALTISDWESHREVELLQAQGIDAGPCGAATLAGLRKYVQDIDPEQKRRMTVVLFSTEGWREYDVAAPR